MVSVSQLHKEFLGRGHADFQAIAGSVSFVTCVANTEIPATLPTKAALTTALCSPFPTVRLLQRCQKHGPDGIQEDVRKSLCKISRKESPSFLVSYSIDGSAPIRKEAAEVGSPLGNHPFRSMLKALLLTVQVHIWSPTIHVFAVSLAGTLALYTVLLAGAEVRTGREGVAISSERLYSGGFFLHFTAVCSFSLRFLLPVVLPGSSFIPSKSSLHPLSQNYCCVFLNPRTINHDYINYKFEKLSMYWKKKL